MEKGAWKVEGMTCTNCALTINQYLQKKGMSDAKVNFIGGEVTFTLPDDSSKVSIAKGIEDLGYHIVDEPLMQQLPKKKKVFSNHLQRFGFCLPFTLVLLLHMLPWHFHFLMNPWIQLAICVPVYWVGMGYFGTSAVKSLRSGIPNMNVLIALGATAAFVYSLIGTIGQLGMEPLPPLLPLFF